MRARVAALGVLLAIATLAGCGGIIAPDLFIVQRTGAAPSSRLTLLVNEEGVVHCNGGRPRHLSDPQLLTARSIQEHLHDFAARHAYLPPQPGSVLSYHLRDADGSVRFSDNSAAQPHVMRELALFVLATASDVCGLPQGGG